MVRGERSLPQLPAEFSEPCNEPLPAADELRRMTPNERRTALASSRAARRVRQALLGSDGAPHPDSAYPSTTGFREGRRLAGRTPENA